MPESFTLPASRRAEDSWLLREIRLRTDSDEAASKILRCIERFGNDPSILHYEISPEPSTRFAGATAIAWTVRAIRS